MFKRKSVKTDKPVIVSQSTTEPILHGGWQDPKIICDEKGILYVSFNGRRDCPETLGLEDKNPVYRSVDMGQTWGKSNHREWIMAHKPLPNGDRLLMREHQVIFDLPTLPPYSSNREKTGTVDSASIMFGEAYTVEELMPVLGERVAKEFKAQRIIAGETEPVDEICKVNWDNMPLQYVAERNMIWRVYPTDKYKVDKNGTLWMTVYGGSVAPDGSMNSKRLCTHLLRSDDFGHTWDYVNTVVYKEEYHGDSLYGVEGFDEATLEILNDGSIIIIMRAGSLEPSVQAAPGTPIPKCYIAKTSDQGKTWDYVKPFYNYGVRPQSVKLENGTIVFISGRPDVYIRTCDDPSGENWNDVIHLIDVPEKDVYNAYFEYTCSNCDVCTYDENTAFVTYSNFQLNTPEGKRAKSILVSKITISE